MEEVVELVAFLCRNGNGKDKEWRSEVILQVTPKRLRLHAVLIAAPFVCSGLYLI